MKTLYLDLSMGVAGDMFSAALAQILEEESRQQFLHNIRSFSLPNLLVDFQKKEVGDISGLHYKVEINGEEEDSSKHHHHYHHHGRSLLEVQEIIASLPVTEEIKNQGKALYEIIAKAEGKAHGKEVGEVHFHEVGMTDAIVDVVSACLLMDHLQVDHVVASTICVGRGKVHCAHGLLDVPAPATKNILEENHIPYYFSEKEYGELTTPTGSAVISYFANEFLEKDAFEKKINKITADREAYHLQQGFGMGYKEFDQPNCVKAYLVIE